MWFCKNDSVRPDAQPEAPTFQPAALRADRPQPPPVGQLVAVQPAVEIPAQGSALTASQPDLIGLIHFLFCAAFSLAHALSLFILLLSWFLFTPVF